MSSKGVVVCTWGEGRDGLPAGAEELLTLARALGGALGVDLSWLVLGSMPAAVPELAGRYAVAELDHLDDPKLERFAPDVYVEAASQYCRENSPQVLLVAQTPDSRLFAPRLAGRLESAVVMNGVGAALDADGALEITASAYGGDTRVVYRVVGGSRNIVALMPNAVLPDPPAEPVAAPAPRRVAVDLGGVEERIRVVHPARFEGPRLEDAEIIVAGGRGLGSQESYQLIEQLAGALGGLPAASRPLVDDGWVDSSRQVGLTGKITRPALYVAVGISGASQHMAGCSAAKTIVAINRDPDAAIFRHARFGIVGDCAEILPELIRAAGQR